MERIAFFDLEVSTDSKRIIDIGCIKDNHQTFHKGSVSAFIEFLNGTRFICGHNIWQHDLKYINADLLRKGFTKDQFIDTLYLSPLFFPTYPSHKLIKDDKLQPEDLNNPLNDSKKAKDLFFEEVGAFHKEDESFKQILYLLLKDHDLFKGFFKYLGFTAPEVGLQELIRNRFKGLICGTTNLLELIKSMPLELAYALSLINSHYRNKDSFLLPPRWVLRNFPGVETVLFLLRNTPCSTGCDFCNSFFDPYKKLKEIFGYNGFRSFGGEPLQEKAIMAALQNKSLLAVFPTGGGKSITFQLPALMQGETSNALTVVISPLQSLMKDQVDNLLEKDITTAVTINGLLNPLERASAIESVENGTAKLLYIAPEALRSPTIERLLLGRNIARFVIDEAHCFSTWGQDFRVDYLFVGDFIRNIREKKNQQAPIPVSCFTATAKPMVIEDILRYFKEKLSIDLEVFSARVSRENLRYKVIPKENEEEKYQTLRSLIEAKNCPTIVYVARTRLADKLADRLYQDGFNAKSFHGKMEKEIKTGNQDSFIKGETQIMVATSAFGMGVDKKDVGLVIHYEISDSLENYIQEAGRAGRDENVFADCYVLFNEEDLNKHFALLNQSKLNLKEIQQVWKAIKSLTKFRSKFSHSALEIARKAGWDDSISDVETRISSAIATLEDAGYLKRGMNNARVYANSIMAKNIEDAMEKIKASPKIPESLKENAGRIIKKLISAKSRKRNMDEVAESRIDYISDHLGIPRNEVIDIINLLKEDNILGDSKDLLAYLPQNRKRSTLQEVETYAKIERLIFSLIHEVETRNNIKDWVEKAEQEGIGDVTSSNLKRILNFWKRKNWIALKFQESRNHFAVKYLEKPSEVKAKIDKRHELCQFIIDYLTECALHQNGHDIRAKFIAVAFSVLEIKEQFENRSVLFRNNITVKDVEDSLLFLSMIDVLTIEGGFMVIYNKLTIEKKEENNKKYTIQDYEKLSRFYENKIQQIHIVGEYAKKMVEDYKQALQFVEDYFSLNYQSFLSKYFNSERQREIKKNITPAKFKQLFGDLSNEQLKILKDNKSQFMFVAAGPGSGKTRVLVHKLASLLLMEDVRHDQLLMLTFSRAAATEFKSRLFKLIGTATPYIDIKTFHSFCFDILGKKGDLAKTNDIIRQAIEKIQSGEADPGAITKSVLVIDEAQDMNGEEYELIKTIIEYNENIRVIAVGDDDQNIFEFRGSSPTYIKQFIQDYQTVRYDLLTNYRSRNNLVEFSNQLAEEIHDRIKSQPLVAHNKANGCIRIINFNSNNLIVPLVREILNSALMGSSCVLTRTNDEALLVVGQLIKCGIKARLIESNDGFSLFDMDEIRYFIKNLNYQENAKIIDPSSWDDAWLKLKRDYGRSEHYLHIENIILKFGEIFPGRKYFSDFKEFLWESKLEDFIISGGDSVIVSTMHKSKGKEFDNIFLMLNGFRGDREENKRLLYVAVTRAKSHLVILDNQGSFNNYNAEELEISFDPDEYPEPAEIICHLGHRDVNLGHFQYNQKAISNLKSGNTLIIKENKIFVDDKIEAVRFSKRFNTKLDRYFKNGYELKNAKVNFIVFWKNPENQREYRVILPELHFVKQVLS